jgi:hypothetical protein
MRKETGKVLSIYEVPFEGVSSMKPNQPTRKERAHHVARMRTNFALEGIHPQVDDLDIEQRYINGAVTLDDMLQHARDFAGRAANADDLREG